MQRQEEFEEEHKAPQKVGLLADEELPAQAEQVLFALGAFAPEPAWFEQTAAEAVVRADAASLSLLLERGLLKQAKDRLALPEAVVDELQPKVPESARARHRDYYLALAKANSEDWRLIEGAYGQIRHAWAVGADEVASDFVEAVRPYQEQRGLWQDTLEWAERALGVVNKQSEAGKMGKLLEYLASARSGLGQLHEALEPYEQALTIYEGIDDKVAQARILMNLGLTYRELKEPQRAVDYFARGRAVAEKIKDKPLSASYCNEISLIYYYQGQLKQALDYDKEALALAVEAQDRRAESRAHYSLGLTYRRLGQLEQALEQFQRALPLLEEEKDFMGLGIVLHNVGLIHFRFGRPEQALDHYSQALPVLRKLKHKNELALLLRNTGRAYHKLSQPTQALGSYKEAVAFAREAGNRSVERKLNIDIAVVFVGQGHLGEAAKHLAKVIRA